MSEIRIAGYQWTVETGGEPVLALESERFYSPSQPPGRSGKHLWKFRAVVPGRVRLQLAFRQKAKAGSPPLQTYELWLAVEDVQSAHAL